MLHLELQLFHHPSSKWAQLPPKPATNYFNYNMKVQAWNIMMHRSLDFGVEEIFYFILSHILFI